MREGSNSWWDQHLSSVGESRGRSGVPVLGSLDNRTGQRLRSLPRPSVGLYLWYTTARVRVEGVLIAGLHRIAKKRTTIPTIASVPATSCRVHRKPTTSMRDQLGNHSKDEGRSDNVPCEPEE